MSNVVRWPKTVHPDGRVAFCTYCETTSHRLVVFCPVCRSRMAMTTIGPPEETRFRRRPVGDLDGAIHRLVTGVSGLDTVLGGGFALGSAVLVAGAAGIGKSTLLVQAAGCLALRGRPVLIASAEEGETQFGDRCRRLFDTPPDTLFFLETFDVEEILDEADGVALLVVDSLQTIMRPDVDADAGAKRQLLACTATLVAWARKTGTPVALLGHVTKDGDAAGPATVKHLVDVVCYLTPGPEGSDPGSRVLTVTEKNRYGVSPCAVALRMGGAGLEEVAGNVS